MQSSKTRGARALEAAISLILGFSLSLPILKCVRGVLTHRLCLYLASLGLYHWAEYLYVCLYHFDKLCFDSKYSNKLRNIGFLLNQSWAYGIAILVSFGECAVTQYLFPSIDPYNYLPWPLLTQTLIGIGLVMMVVGHYFRISAEMTAGRNFNHVI